MIHCVFDNPKTYRREVWCDGKLDSFIDCRLLLSRDFLAYSHGTPPFKPGKVHEGSLKAMAEINQ